MIVRRTVKTNIIASTLISVSFGLVGNMLTPTASAASLVSASLTLPLGSLGQPATSLLNPLTQSLPTPVTIQSSPTTLNANINTPLLSDPVGVNVSLPSLLSPPTNPTAQQPVTPLNNPPNSSGELTVQTGQPTQQISIPTEFHTANSPESASFIDGFTSFFTSTLPDTLSRIASTIVGKEVDPLPIAISAIVFLITLTAIGAIVYTTNHGGRVVIGQYNLTKFAKTHDMSQMAALVMTIVSLGVVTIFLTLKL